MANAKVGGLKRALFVAFLLADEVVVILAVVWVLNFLGIHLSWELYLVLFVVLGGFSLLLYRLFGPIARKPVLGAEGMIDAEGEVFADLVPQGLVRIKGEIWKAESTTSETIPRNEKVVVVRVEGLTLMVERARKTGGIA